MTVNTILLEFVEIYSLLLFIASFEIHIEIISSSKKKSLI